jgi:hypothetical protein
MWLTVSNKGAARVNEEALHIMGVTETDRAVGCRADPKVSDCRIVPRAGILVRLTRNCDKQRGFVNGAIGEIVTVLSPNCFTVRLKTGTMVLVHPMCGNKEVPFLPCTYGYATTIRRAQGMTLNRGCVFFDLAFPPDRGYAYVAVSRFRTRAGVYHFGRYRRSDWLPVGEAVEGEQTQRSYESMSSESDEEHDASEDESDEAHDSSDDSICGNHQCGIMMLTSVMTMRRICISQHSKNQQPMMGTIWVLSSERMSGVLCGRCEVIN